MNLTDSSRILKSVLKIDSAPVAVKFVEANDGQVAKILQEDGFTKPDEPVNACQLLAVARLYGRKIIANNEVMACIVGAVALNFADAPRAMTNGYLALASRKDLKVASEFVSTVPRVQGKPMDMVACAPLDVMPLDPDLVVVYGNSLQVMKMIQAYLWDKPGRLDVSLGGEFSVCADIIAKTFMTNSFQFSIPCIGERTSSGVSDNELSVGIPMKDLNSICETLKQPQFQSSITQGNHQIDKMPMHFPNVFLTDHAKKFKSERLKERV